MPDLSVDADLVKSVCVYNGRRLSQRTLAHLESYISPESNDRGPLHLRILYQEPLGQEDFDSRVQKRAAWILRQQREFESYPPELPPRQYVSGESHRYLGKQYRLKVIEAEVESVKLTRGRFIVCLRNKQVTDQVKRLLDDWYRKQARRVFAERLILHQVELTHRRTRRELSWHRLDKETCRIESVSLI